MLIRMHTVSKQGMYLLSYAHAYTHIKIRIHPTHSHTRIWTHSHQYTQLHTQKYIYANTQSHASTPMHINLHTCI